METAPPPPPPPPAFREHMLETLARAATTGGSPRDIRAAFRVTSRGGAVISEIAGPLGSLPHPIAQLLEAAAGGASPDGGTLFCSVDPRGDGTGTTGDRASAEAAADAVASASIATVCIATPWAPPWVPGFVDALREHRIDVHTELCAGEAVLLNEAPIVAARRGTPFVHLFAVQSVDGRSIPLEEAPGEVARVHAELAWRYEDLRAPAGDNLAEIVSSNAWDRLTVITVPQVRGSGGEVIGDLGVREMSDVYRIDNAAWWAGAGTVGFTGYRDLADTFGEGLARSIGDTVPSAPTEQGIEVVDAAYEAAPRLHDAGVLAALGYHRPNS